MSEIFNVWKKPRLLVLASYTAAIYAAVLIPFKYGLPIIPGATEIRPGVAVLVLCAFLFGPAAAWGGAFGNLIGDFFGGTLGIGSIFGFVGNFLLAYLPYRAWELMNGGRPVPKADPIWWFKYVLTALLASGACAATIAWGLDMAVRLPFFILGDIIFFNNMLMLLVLTPLLLGLIVPRMEAWGFTYRQMEPLKAKESKAAWAGLFLALISTAVLMVGGNALSRSGWTQIVTNHFPLPDKILKYPPGALAPVILLLLFGTVLMDWGKRFTAETKISSLEKEAASGATGAVAMKDVSFRYTKSDQLALDNVTLEIKPGEFLVVMGRTGAGKSTLARCITGAVPHFYQGEFSGRVIAGGWNPAISGPAENANSVGMIFEDFESQLFSTNVALEVAFGPENLGMPQKQIESAVKSSLVEVGLDGFENRDPAELSGGEKQRLAVAATLAMETPMIILDEPTTDLDPLGKEELFNVLKKLRDKQKTVLVIEHEVEAADGADKIVLMENGKIDAADIPDNILRNSYLLEKHGVRPHDSVKLFAALGEKNPPLDSKTAATQLLEAGFAPDESKYSRLLDEEKRREEIYGTEIIRVEDLHHIYKGGTEALRGVDLTVRKGEFVALLGHNGSGKTTLAKHLNGLLRPTKGRALLEGEPICDMLLSRAARRVGYVFQNPDHQLFSATVADEVAFAPINFGFAPEEIRKSVHAALDATGLVGREQMDPFHMTKGERQRVAVASVLAGMPEVLILDEPTTGLDLDEQRSIMELLKRLNREGHTVIIITHTIWVAAQYAHRTVLMNGGRILADGPTRKVFGMEEALAAASVRQPQVTQIGLNAFGKVFLGADEMASCLKKRGA